MKRFILEKVVYKKKWNFSSTTLCCLWYNTVDSWELTVESLNNYQLSTMNYELNTEPIQEARNESQSYSSVG